MKRLLTFTALMVLLSSHELFLKTDSYFPEAHSSAELYLFNGTFLTSENTISRDRIIHAGILGPEYEFLPSEGDYHDRGNITYLRFNTGGGGTYVAGVSTLPRVIELTGAEFGEYLEHEGLTGVIQMRGEQGISGSPAREKYAKHVKAILQVGGNRTGDYATELGYPIEFIPLENPYSLNVGDSLSFQLMLNGHPLPGQVVHYSSRQAAGNLPDDDFPARKKKQMGEEGGTGIEKATKTDKDGQFTIKLDGPGRWYVATIHMTESGEEGLDYESSWATLTFEVR